MNERRIISLFAAIGLFPIVVLVIVHHAIASGSTLAALQRIPVHKTDRDEPEEARRLRLAEIAGAIDAVSRSRTERAALIVLGEHESGFARDVCSGERLGDAGRAYGCWQSHDRDRSGGVREQAERAIRDLRRARNYCSSRVADKLEGAFALYGTGASCAAEWAAKRARKTRALEWKL